MHLAVEKPRVLDACSHRGVLSAHVLDKFSKNGGWTVVVTWRVDSSSYMEGGQ